MDTQSALVDDHDSGDFDWDHSGTPRIYQNLEEGTGTPRSIRGRSSVLQSSSREIKEATRLRGSNRSALHLHQNLP